MSEITPHVLTFPQAGTARFELRCWGEFSLTDRIRREDCSPRGRKARAIVAYLASHGDAAVGRERLAALLWSERGDEQARGSLRQSLRELRPYAVDGVALLVIEHDHVRLNAPALTSDAAQIEECARADDVAALSRMLRDKGDPLFGGLDGLDPAFDEWLALERRVQEDRLVSLATAAAERGLQRGEFGAIARLTTQLQALDETHEAIAQIGMRADHAAGDRSGVRRRHRRLCEGLKHDLGIGPSPETEALFRKLDSAEEPARAAPASPTPGTAPLEEAPPQPRFADPAQPAVRFPRRSLAALWAVRRSAIVASLLALLAAGGAAWLLRDGLPGRPGVVPRMQVAGFTALETDPGTRDYAVRLSDHVAGLLKDNLVGLSLVAPPDPGAAKTADLRLSGTVSREGDEWRVKASLEEPRRGVTLWAQEFQRPARQEEALEFEVAGAAGEAVSTTVDVLQENAARRNPYALADMVQGVAAIDDPGLTNLGRPRRLLEDAVARAPNFAGARAGLAFALLGESEMTPGPEGKLLADRAGREADRAIRTDAAAAGAAYDALYLIARKKAPTDLASAEDILIDGIAKAPRFPFLYMRRCKFLIEAGLAREALPYCQQSLARSPLTVFNSLVSANELYALGAPEAAANVVQKIARLHPDQIITRQVQFEIAAFAGSPDDASTLMHQPFDIAPHNSFAALNPEGARLFEMLLQARKSGAPADADRAIAALTAAVRSGHFNPHYLVWGAAALGRPDDAFATLEEVAAGRIPNARLTDEYLFAGGAAPLWRDRRIWPLAAQAGYARYWRTRGVLPDFCSDGSLPYDCRKEAASVAGIRPLVAPR
jgi:DNA-binding SARP family transcriptional activator